MSIEIPMRREGSHLVPLELDDLAEPAVSGFEYAGARRVRRAEFVED